ncbi:MAG: hypothetical protein KBD64_04045 [Gammaproteobacteria bacterium]|nr:hypothetical protein [Gammaproteobacteria bacterium]
MKKRLLSLSVVALISVITVNNSQAADLTIVHGSSVLQESCDNILDLAYKNAHSELDDVNNYTQVSKWRELIIPNNNQNNLCPFDVFVSASFIENNKATEDRFVISNQILAKLILDNNPDNKNYDEEAWEAVTDMAVAEAKFYCQVDYNPEVVAILKKYKTQDNISSSSRYNISAHLKC